MGVSIKIATHQHAHHVAQQEHHQALQNSQQELLRSARLSFQATNMCWLIRLGLTPSTLPGISMRRVTESGSSLTTPSHAHSSAQQRPGFTSQSCTRSVLTHTQRERCEECDLTQLREFTTTQDNNL